MTSTLSLRALVVEDDLELQAVYVKLLERAGFNVIAVKDGLSAVEAFKKDPPALMIVDFLLPRLDGLKVIEQVVAVKKVPIVFVSAVMRDASVTAKLRGMGVQWIVEKPFRVDALRKALSEAIAAATGKAAAKPQ